MLPIKVITKRITVHNYRKSFKFRSNISRHNYSNILLMQTAIVDSRLSATDTRSSRHNNNIMLTFWKFVINLFDIPKKYIFVADLSF